MLQNKGGLWKSNDMWNFNHINGSLVRIENINKTKVWGTTNLGKVILEVYVEGKADQLWKKGKPNAEGYITLENYKVSSWFVTAASSTSLKLEGNITLRECPLMTSDIGVGMVVPDSHQNWKLRVGKGR